MGFSEFVLIAIIGLLVIGPKRLPEAARFVGLWVGRLRRMLAGAKTEFEKEFGLDEVRRQLHNEQVMDTLDKQLGLSNEISFDKTPAAKVADTSQAATATPEIKSDK